MADGTNGSANNFPPTALSEWLRLSEVTANRLATILEITPRSAYALARGDSDLVSTKTLIAVSDYTGLSIDDLLRPYYASALATDTGSSRINTLLAKIANHLHSDRCYDKLAQYIHPDFLCSGSEYALNNAEPMNFRDMCDANSANPYNISSALLSAIWYTPGNRKATDSINLHTYWRSMLTDRGAHTTIDTTFVVYKFAKSISQMNPLEKPKIVSWWWHRPTELHAEFSTKRIQALTDQSLLRNNEIDLIAEMRENELRKNVHLNPNPEHNANKTTKFSGQIKTDN